MGQSTSTLSPEQMATIKAQVDALIAENAIMVFSKSYCPYCTKAKKLLATKNRKVVVIELDDVENGSDIQAYLQQLTGQRTVPNIFILQKHIGGCDDLFALDKRGELDTLLSNVPKL